MDNLSSLRSKGPKFGPVFNSLVLLFTSMPKAPMKETAPGVLPVGGIEFPNYVQNRTDEL